MKMSTLLKYNEQNKAKPPEGSQNPKAMLYSNAAQTQSKLKSYCQWRINLLLNQAHQHAPK
jgi:hypothetical protein